MTKNNLTNETSPYLLQHKDNPVHWYAWSDEPLKKAKSENKPIFLSVGYSSCHWCHVMAHESFEDPNIAEIMNKHFINIKVDREELPDIDDIYQKICQSATGQGGWPLSVFLTPDQRPFYVGTYFPILDTHGRPGFGSILNHLAKLWDEKPSDVKKAADNLMQGFDHISKEHTSCEITRDILDEAAFNLLQMGDVINGGFGQAPKFPNSSNLCFLFRYSKISGISKFQDFALKSLRKMASGGIFDHLGGGFHRYSTDSRWLVPHFEKMLYDNALLPIAYSEAFQITKDEFFLNVVKKTLDYVLREMTSINGAFFSAQDADTDGIEGLTYTWTKKEIIQILKDDAELFCMYYDVTDGGNFEGKTILNNSMSPSSIAFKFGLTEEQVHEKIISCEKILLEKRKIRKQPGLDDKILTSWNSLMISAFVKGYRVTDDVIYLNAAVRCLEFLKTKQFDGSKLLHTFKSDVSKIAGYLDDYAYLINAVLDVFEESPKKSYLDFAIILADYICEHFWDSENHGFFFTDDQSEKLIHRPKTDYDLAIPSGNSAAAAALLRLYHFTRIQKYFDKSMSVQKIYAQSASENPFAYGNLLNVISMSFSKPLEITVLNSSDSQLYDYVKKSFLPESIIVGIPNLAYLSELSGLDFFAGKEFSLDNSVAFVCRDSVCSLPIKSVDDLTHKIN